MSFDKIICLEVVDRNSLINTIVARKKKQSNWLNITRKLIIEKKRDMGQLYFIRVGVVKLQLSQNYRKLIQNTFADTSRFNQHLLIYMIISIVYLSVHWTIL